MHVASYLKMIKHDCNVLTNLVAYIGMQQLANYLKLQLNNL